MANGHNSPSARGNPGAIRPGRFRHTVQLASNSKSGQDASGQVQDIWTPYCTTNAEIAQLSGQQLYQSDQFTSAAQVRISMRWQGAGVTINVGDRIFYPSVAAPTHVYIIQIADSVLQLDRLVNLICLEIDGTP